MPPGLKFVSANNAGYYEESTRTVRWRLEELPANETGSVELVTMPVEAGQHAIKLRGTAQKGLVVEKEQPVLVEGIAAILFQVADTVDPVEVGGETTYEVRVVNQGSKAAANVRLAVDLAAGVEAAGGRRADAVRARRQPRGLRRPGPIGAEGRDDLPRPRQGPAARRPPRPLPTADRRHADAGHQGREHAGVRGRVGQAEGRRSDRYSQLDLSTSLADRPRSMRLTSTPLNSASRRHARTSASDAAADAQDLMCSPAQGTATTCNGRAAVGMTATK